MTIKQPKHVVLTARNTETLTHRRVKEFKAAFARLRRSRFARNWRGGFYSLELTNEGRGWHLHLHALIDANWIDAKELAIQWSRYIGQDFAIVKVKDTRDRNYLAEVTKYVADGQQIATWTAEAVTEYVLAFAGLRTFGVFGSLYGRRKEFTDWLKQLQYERPVCPCGCTRARILTLKEWEWLELTNGSRPDYEKPLQPSLRQTELILNTIGAAFFA